MEISAHQIEGFYTAQDAFVQQIVNSVSAVLGKVSHCSLKTDSSSMRRTLMPRSLGVSGVDHQMAGIVRLPANLSLAQNLRVRPSVRTGSCADAFGGTITAPILTNTQVEDVGITIAHYHLTPNDVDFSPLSAHMLTWNIGKPGDLVKREGKHS